MKILKKHLSAAIAFALMLTIAATFITSVPVTFGALIPTGNHVFALPYIVGVGQKVLIQGVVYPKPPGYPVSDAVYKDLVFMITRPDKTVENVTMNSNTRSEAWFWYNCTQLGTYEVRLYFPGDATHGSSITAAGDRYAWVVQTQSTPLLEKTTPTAFVATSPPDKVGLGERIYIVGWITPPQAQGFIYYDVKFTVTKPDGTTVTEVKDTDTPATASYSIVCDQEGTWRVKLSYDGDKIRNSCESAIHTWTVEKDYVTPTIPQEPLPVGPWGYPISAEDYEWYQISGAWPQARYNASSSNFNPFSKAPNTPHVLWTYQVDKGGIMGGETGYFSWSPTAYPAMVAAQGRLYYTKAEAIRDGTGSSTTTHPVLYCLDQFTGELIYRRDLPGTGSGGIPNLELAQGFKADPRYAELEFSSFSIWLTSGGLWQIDPWTGETTYYNSALSGTYHDGAIYMDDYPRAGNWTKWDTQTRSITWTVQMPWIAGRNRLPFPTLFWNDVAVAGLFEHAGILYGTRVWSWNLETGELLVNGVDAGYSTTMRMYSVADGKTFVRTMDRRTVAVDVYTGRTVWKSEPMDYPWGVFSCYIESYSWGPNGGGGNGQVYVPSYDGHLYAYDLATGKTNWAAFTENTTETAMGVYGTWSQPIIADSKVYFSIGEHTTPQPMPRGGKLYCVDVNTGERIWELDGFTGSRNTQEAGVSSGILWYPNRYDGCLYAFGKGTTATTVSVSQSPIANGGSTVIQGTVTDQSPGAPGTPAVSDASQAQWVQYLYMNKPMPTNATGVPVMLRAMRSDDSVIDIGHVTTDIMGHFEYLWTPPNTDTYKILATFEGSESYWTSSAQAALGVTAAPPAPATPEAAPDNTPMYILGATVAIIIAVAIATILILRKRP